MTNTKCRSCGYQPLNRFLALGDIPPVNAFLETSEIPLEKKYPLNLAYCPHCFLVQLEEIVPPDTLFRNYLHLSSGSGANISHLKEVAELLTKRFNVTKETSILEIGSNDGTLLNFFKAYTPKVIGVDPAKNLEGVNREKGIDYVSEFFDTKTASELVRRRGQIDLIVALNVIPHTPDNIDLLKASRIVLKDSGTLVMEGVYALETILNGEFDTIYHEHVYTFSLHALISTFRMAGFKVVDIERIPTQGGSLRVYAMKEECALPVSNSVNELLRHEERVGLSDPKTYDSVEKKVRNFRADLRKMIEEELALNGKLIGLGAPARGVVIMNYCNLTNREIEYIVDDTSLKHGRVAPGVHIPVKPFSELEKEKNRTFFLLSWNYKESFIERLKKIFPSFRVIIPFPTLQIFEYG